MKKILAHAIDILIIGFVAIAIFRIFARTEICKGICLDDYGNGKVYNGEPYYNYINYERTTAKAGDEVLTIDLLNPLNNACDDIVFRYDIVLKKGE